MAQALYRTWRPKTFDDVVGQEHITTTLKNQIATRRVGHAYLFVGPRGCGKTTTARILAHAINTAGMDSNSPEALRIVDEVTNGYAIDVIEIDAASHTGVDDIRELRDNVAFRPSSYSSKVYIIDEVHMLSNSAFNALLKTLEEPPPNVIFILATTDAQKIPATVLSRCQRFNFKRVPVKLMVSRLHTLCNAENIETDDHALMLIARSATGSLRDAISLLDQLASSNSMRITADDVREALGATDAATVRGLMDGIASHDAAAGMDAIQTAIDQGSDARQIALQMVDFLRAVLQMKVSQKDALEQKGEISESEKLDLSNFAGRVSAATLLRGIRAFSASINEMRSSVDAQLPLVMAYLECAVFEEASDDGSKRPEAGSQRSEVRGQKSEVRGQRSEAGGQRSEVRSQKPEVTPEVKTHRQETGVVTAETLRSIWKQLISEVNAVNKPAAALLRSCHPYSVDGDIIRIKADHDLFRQRLDDPRNKDVVTSTMNQLLNGTFVVHVFTGQPEQEPNPNDDPLVKAAQKLGGKLRE